MQKAKLASTAILLIAAVAVVLWSVEASAILDSIRKISLASIAVIFVALFANVLVAALRIKVIASDIGHRLTFPEAMAAVSVGGLASAAFFQLAGQLIGRGYVMARSSGMPFAAVAVMTLYERAVAALVSGLLALAGAYFVFGQVYLDRNAGGGELIKITCGLFVVVIAGALAGYGRRATEAIAPYLTQEFTWRCLRAVGLSVLVQLPMMAAYVVAARAFSPHTPLVDLIAASAIVMFAASVPISLAGWGVREMSAILALGVIGVGVAQAALAAVIVGAGSMLTMAIMALGSLGTWLTGAASRSRQIDPPAFDYEAALIWSLPIAAAMLVLFQIYVPISSGTLLNVNLADPVAMLGGALFVLKAVRESALPKWRFLRFNMAVAAATVVLTVSLLLGAARIGWTEWAVINRYLGWFVLLCYLATASLLIRRGGDSAFRIFLLTYAAAGTAVAALEIGLLALGGLGISHLPVNHAAIEGFAQNRNFLAFQFLMAIAATMVAARDKAQRIVMLALLMAGLWFSGSRSGWIALAFLVVAGLYTRAAGWRETAIAVALAAALALVVGLIPVLGVWLIPAADYGGRMLIPPVLPSELSSEERLVSLIGGLRMFLDHPILGAGLGAFRNQMILARSGIPLLIHSTPLWLLAEAGVVGFLAFFVPALYLLLSEFARARGDAGAKLMVLCLVAFGVMAMPADMLYQRTFWLLVGAGLALMPQDSSPERKAD